MKLYLAFFTIFRPESAQNKYITLYREATFVQKMTPTPGHWPPHPRLQVTIQALTGPWQLTQCWSLLTIDDLRLAGTGPYWAVLYLLTTSYSSFFNFRLPPRLFHDINRNVSCLPATNQYSFLAVAGLSNNDYTISNWWQFCRTWNLGDQNQWLANCALKPCVINICKSYGTNTNINNVRVFL